MKSKMAATSIYKKYKFSLLDPSMISVWTEYVHYEPPDASFTVCCCTKLIIRNGAPRRGGIYCINDKNLTERKMLKLQIEHRQISSYIYMNVNIIGTKGI